MSLSDFVFSKAVHRWSNTALYYYFVACVVGVLLGTGISGFSYAEQGATDLPGIELDAKLPAVIASGRLLGMTYAVGAGIVVGVAGGMAARSHSLLATLAASVVAAASATETIVLWQWHRGRWPVGAIDGKIFAVAATLVLIIGSASVLAALAVFYGADVLPDRIERCAKRSAGAPNRTPYVPRGCALVRARSKTAIRSPRRIQLVVSRRGT